MKKSLFWLLALVLSPVAVLVVITPMDSQKQYIFGLLSIGILFLMGFSKRRSVSVIMVVTSLLMSTRYMYFRLTQTLHFNSAIETILGMGLFLAEVYIWVMLLLNYLQTVWPLKRGIVPLPDDMSKWPTVDIYIPSYNEPLEVVRDTVLAAQCIDYPKDKMKIYLLDDGKRSEFAVFAADVGVGYITRNDNKHAKAGNLNHALTLPDPGGAYLCFRLRPRRHARVSAGHRRRLPERSDAGSGADAALLLFPGSVRAQPLRRAQHPERRDAVLWPDSAGQR